MAQGILSYRLGGYRQGVADAMQRDQGNLRQAMGILGLMQQARQQQLAEQMLPLKMQEAQQMGDYRRAQIEKMHREAVESQRRQAASSALSGILSGGFQGVPGQQEPVAAPDAVMLNEQAALDAAIKADKEGRQVRIDVPNAGLVQGLAIQADPDRAIPEILKQSAPPKPMSEYERARLDRPIAVAGGYLSPSGGFTRTQQDRPDAGKRLQFVTGTDEAGRQQVTAFDPVTGGRVTQHNLDSYAPGFYTTTLVGERQKRSELERNITRHRDVLDAAQRFEEIRASGDSSQANQFLAQQLLQMSRRGERALPESELQRILGSTELGGNLSARFENWLSQALAGVRTPEIDQKLDEMANAMSRASATRISQEIRNVRASVPPGVDPERIIGAQPRIYGKYVVTPSGKVHTFKSAAEAQQKLDEASKVVQ